MSYELNFEYLLSRLAPEVPAAGLDEVRRAYDVARKVHATQFRDEGSPYIVHPIRVAVSIIDELKLYSPKLVCSALLHDVIEDSPPDDPVTRSHIAGWFDEEIAEIVWLLTKLEEVSLPEYLARIEAAAETGAAIVKLCDRLDNMRSVIHTPKLEKKQRYIRTTEALYLPMAARLNQYLHDELHRCLEEARNQVGALANDW
jgi:guanosine-3',5'-bis(diphosphate) 3'-pyrophosphohydrolase